MPRLVLGGDAGGRRWFLEGRAVHAGEGLELRLPGNDLGEFWTRVRFEMTFPPGPYPPDRVLRAPDDQVPVLYLYVGHAWERRFQVVEAEAVPATRADGRGRWAIYDRRRGRVALPSEHTLGDVEGETRRVYPELNADTYASRSDAERAAAQLQAEMEGVPSLVIPLVDVTQVELRWPVGAGSTRI